MSPNPEEHPRHILDSRDSESSLGVLDFLSWNHPWNNRHYSPEDQERALDLMAEAGVGWVRMDFFWADLEPTPGSFDFERYDRIIQSLRSRNIAVLGLLHYNPLWRPVLWNAAPNPDDYLRYAMATCEHFKSAVRYWEIWNEPDHEIYWVPQDGMTAYSELLRKVYPALKKVDPTCQILLGGLSNPIPQRLREVYLHAGKDVFDIVNIHPFVNPLDADPLGQLDTLHRAVHEVMAEFEDSRKRVWWTEIGCPGIAAGQAAQGWWLGKSPTEDQQADWVARLYGERSRYSGVDKIFWAFFRDTADHFHSDVDYFGLVRNDFSRKPAFAAYGAVDVEV